MDKLQQVVGDYETFLKNILAEVAGAGFDFADFVQLDHLCYRVSTLEVYEQKKQELRAVGDLLSEVRVGGRPISTFKLHRPLQHENWRIDIVELPAPKPDVPTPEGLEHIEFVLFDSLDDFVKKHADKKFNMAAANRGVNPDVTFKLPSYSVKFHVVSLSAAVYLEQKLGLTDI